jgi:hypothetical protein
MESKRRIEINDLPESTAPNLSDEEQLRLCGGVLPNVDWEVLVTFEDGDPASAALKNDFR